MQPKVSKCSIYANEVLYYECEAAKRGVHGVTYILFDGEFAVLGTVTPEAFKTALRDILCKVKEKP